MRLRAPVAAAAVVAFSSFAYAQSPSAPNAAAPAAPPAAAAKTTSVPRSDRSFAIKATNAGAAEIADQTTPGSGSVSP